MKRLLTLLLRRPAPLRTEVVPQFGVQSPQALDLYHACYRAVAEVAAQRTEVTR